MITGNIVVPESVEAEVEKTLKKITAKDKESDIWFVALSFFLERKKDKKKI